MKLWFMRELAANKLIQFYGAAGLQYF